MIDIFIDFRWQRDAAGYEIVSTEASTELMVRRKPGGKLVDAPRLEKISTLYLAFAQVQKPKDVIDFFNKFGPLTNSGNDEGEPISRVLENSQVFRDLLHDSEKQPKRLAARLRGEGLPVGRLVVFLVSDEITDAPRLRIEPPNLFEAMLLQLARKLTGNIKRQACLHCGRWFEVGPGTGRRLDATFCSDEHRILHNSKKRTKGK